MKRTLTIVCIVLGVLGIGATAAFAGSSGDPSYQCRDGLNPTQATVPGYALGAEGGQQGPDETGATVCYSDTPNGTPSNVAGGFVHLRQDQDGETFLWCNADPGTVFTLNCSSYGYVQTTDDGNPDTVGRTVSAQVIVANDTVGQTGAQANPATTVNLPGDGNSISAASLGVGTGTCVWVDGGTPNCPTGVTVLGVTVNEADLVPAVTLNDTTPPCTIGVDNQCLPTGGTVRIFNDTANPTLSVETVATEDQPVDLDPDGTCVQVNAVC